jgi:GTP-binding protein EngB required for normal cell division
MEDETAVIKEVPRVERRVVERFCEISGKKLTLSQASLSQIQHVLDSQGCSQWHRLDKASKKKVSRFMNVAGIMTDLRSILSTSVYIAWVGVHNAGKSSWLNKLWNFNTHPDALIRTEELNMYSLDDKADIPIRFLDFPGSTDERQPIAEIFERLKVAPSLLVCVFSALHVAGPEKEVVNIAKRSNRPFIVLINKIDAVPALMQRLDEAKQRFAEVLGVMPDQILLTSINDLASIDQVRIKIFRAVMDFSRIPDEDLVAIDKKSANIDNILAANIAPRLLLPEHRRELYNAAPDQLSEEVNMFIGRMLINEIVPTAEMVAQEFRDKGRASMQPQLLPSLESGQNSIASFIRAWPSVASLNSVAQADAY